PDCGGSETGTLFCPGAVFPPGLAQVKVAKPPPLRANVTSPPPSPASVPPEHVTVSVAVPVVLNVQDGAPPFLKCALVAIAAEAVMPTVSRTITAIIVRLIPFPSSRVSDSRNLRERRGG